MVGERYPAAMRAEAVRRVLAGERIVDVARRFGVNRSTIGTWVRRAAAGDAGRPSLEEARPDLVAELDPDRNPGVDPAALTPGSARRLWWRCPGGHVWEAPVYRRTRGAGCPVCAGRYHQPITVTHPDLVAQLHPADNPGLDPATVTAGSRRRLWWRCPRGHPWQAEVAHRTGGSGCPECARRESRRRAWEATAGRPTLRESHPDLAAQLDPVRNPGLRLDRLTAGSGRRLWWRCPHGHPWQATVTSRVQGAGCPVCSGHRAGPLATTHPTLAGELDPDRNPPDLSGDRIHAGSHGLVWWRCPAGHAWQDTPLHRAQGAGCPTCTPTTRPVGGGRLCAHIYTDPADPRAGTRCRGSAVPGTDRCPAHQPPDRPRCTATTKTGRPCANPAEPGRDTCPLHDPSRQVGVSPAPAPLGRDDRADVPRRLGCPICGRVVGVVSVATGPDGETRAVLAAHQDPDRRRCPGRLVAPDHCPPSGRG